MKKSLFLFLCLPIFYSNGVYAADIADLKKAKKEAGWNTLLSTVAALGGYTAGMGAASHIGYTGEQLLYMPVRTARAELLKVQAARALFASAGGTFIGTIGLTGYFLLKTIGSLVTWAGLSAMISIENQKQSK